MNPLRSYENKRKPLAEYHANVYTEIRIGQIRNFYKGG